MNYQKPFKASVVVEPGRLGRYREVRSVEEAHQVLQGRWPETRGKRYYAALRACNAALKDETPAYIARRAFIAAAEESRVLISDGR